MKPSLAIHAFVTLIVAVLTLAGVAVVAYRALDALVEPAYSASLWADVRSQIRYLLAVVSGASVLVTAASAVMAIHLFQRRRERQALQESERQHRALSAQLAAANAELLAFTYTVSHDLRAPLRAMEGFAHALIEDHAERLGASGAQYARRIADAAHRMDELIQDLLAYSRVGHEEFHLHDVGIETAVQDALAHLQADLQRTRAEVRVAGPLPRVWGHHALLVQILDNLLSNAIKFVAPGVVPRVRVSADAGQDGVVLCVADNGIGIAPECRERIFNVFERLHGVESYPGTGIGLAIVRRASARMGGRVLVEPSPDGGSVFRVFLRAARGADASRARQDAADRRP